MTDAAPSRADRLIAYLHMGHDLETAARLCHMRNETAMIVTAIDIAVEKDIREQEDASQRNADLDKVLAHDDDHMVAAWDALIEGTRH